MLDAEIAVRHHESTSMQLGPINNVTCRCSFAHGLGPQCPEAASWRQGGLAQAMEEMERRIVGTLEKAIAPIFTSVAAIKERLNEIVSRQLELKKAQENGWEDIKQRIDDVEQDLMKEMKKKA